MWMLKIPALRKLPQALKASIEERSQHFEKWLSYAKKDERAKHEKRVTLDADLWSTKRLLKIEQDKEKQDCLDKMAAGMESASLSDGLLFYIHTIFFYVHMTDEKDQNEFFDILSMAPLIALRRLKNMQQRFFSDKSKDIERRKRMLVTKSFSRLDEFDIQSDVLEEKMKAINMEFEQTRERTFLLFLLVVDIVSYLEETEKLPQALALRIKNDAIKTPLIMIKKLIPVLVKLQMIGHDEPETTAIPKLDRAIAATLQLLDIKEDQQALVLLVRGALFAKGCLGMEYSDDQPSVGASDSSSEDETETFSL